MANRFSRTELLLGKEGMDKLKKSRVAVFGIGGVGSFASEALIRSGLGEIIIVDYDIIDETNINRQIHANTNTVGSVKVDIMKKRLIDINPDLKVVAIRGMYKGETRDRFLSKDYDYVIDAIDMVSAKIDLVEGCSLFGIPIISCMGMGNKLNPTMVEVGDIYSTNTCPLAKVMRKELRKKTIKALKVVWSPEKPLKVSLTEAGTRKPIPGSVSFVPSVAGLILASEVVKDIIFGGVN